eukprot:s478_g7.t1
MDLDTLDETSGEPASETRTAGVGEEPSERAEGAGEIDRWQSWDWSSWSWWDSWNHRPYDWQYSYTTVRGPWASNGVTSSAVQTEPGIDPWQTGADPWGTGSAAAAAVIAPATTTSATTPTTSSADQRETGPASGFDRWGWTDRDWRRGGWTDGSWNGGYKPDYADPPSFPGWGHRRLWVQAVRRWDKLTDVPVHRRAEKLLRTLGWEMQVDFEHIDENVLSSAAYLDAIIEVMNNKAGVREDDEKRRAYRQAIVENQRKRDETLAQYSVRRLQDFRAAATYGIQLPGELRAMLLREGAGLSDQNMQNLAALTLGRESDPDAVARALGRMDVRHDRLTAFAEGGACEESYMAELEEASAEEDPLDDAEVLKELEPLDLNEDQVTEVFAVLEQRRRTWRENKLFKANMKKDRGSFVKDGGHSFPRGQSGGVPGAARDPPRGRMNKEQLKKISRCRLCNKKGHWAEDCHLKKKPSGGPVGFAYCGDGSSITHSAFSFLTAKDLREVISSVIGAPDGWSFLSLPQGEAVLDTGATQDLIGSAALAELSEGLKAVGLQPIRVDRPVVTPAGIGGTAKALGVVLIPVSIEGSTGVLEMTILDGAIPPLLSVGFLEFLRAKIDLETDMLKLGALGLEVPMRKLSTGHRTIPLNTWKGGMFPIPSPVAKKYHLGDHAFNISGVSCAYTKLSADRPLEVESICENQGVCLNQGNCFEPNCNLRNFSSPKFVETCDETFLQNQTDIPVSAAESRSCHDTPHALRFTTHDMSCMTHTYGDHLNMEEHHVADSRSCHVTGSRSCAVTGSGVIGQRQAGQGPCELEGMSCDTGMEIDHGADPQHLQTESSRYPMGCRQSNQQFDSSAPRDGRPLSYERRGDRAALVAPHPAMDTADGADPLDVGGNTAALHEPGARRTENQGEHRKCYEAADASWARGGPLPAPTSIDHSSVESVRHLERLWEVQCQADLSLQATLRADTKGQSEGINEPSDNHSGAHVPVSGRDTSSTKSGDCSNIIITGRDHGDSSRSTAEFPASEFPAGTGDHAGQSFPARALTGTGTHDHDDGQSSRVGDPSRSTDAGLVSGGGSDRVREFGQSKRNHVRPSWPAWMLALGATSTSALLMWPQCSPEFQSLLRDQGVTDEYYMVQYDLGRSSLGSPTFEHQVALCPKECVGDKDLPSSGVPRSDREPPRSKALCSATECPVPGDCLASEVCPDAALWNELREIPSWLPDFVQTHEHRAQQATSLEEEVDGEWCSLWRRVVDLKTLEILEDSPGPHRHLDFARPLDLWVCRWGLPMDFVAFSSFSSHAQPPIQVVVSDNEQAHQIWAFHASDLLPENLDLCQGGISDVGARADLQRCALNLTLMARQMKTKGAHHVDFVELFSPPRVSSHAIGLGLRVDTDQVFDLTFGWDVRKKDHRQKFREFQKKRQPSMMMASPECKAFSPLMALNEGKMNPETYKRMLHEGILMWDFSLEAIDQQLAQDDLFGLEHPGPASSWKLPQTQKLVRRRDVALINFDMCAWGLSVVPEGELSRKTTKIATNNPWLARKLLLAQCDGQHQHRQLIGGLPALAQEYPAALCEAIAQSTKDAVTCQPIPSFLELPACLYDPHRPSCGLGLEDGAFIGFEEGEEDDEEVNDAEGPRPEAEIPRISESQKRLIHRVHINTGHPPKERFLRALRAAGALPQVLHYVQNEYQCDDCQLRQRPDFHRKAQLPRTFSFNKVVCLDFLYVKWRDLNVAIFNMVDLGTGFQAAVRAPIAEGTHGGTPTSQTAWRVFVTSWVRFYGAPHMVICDAGNEFKGHFERSLENAGILQHVIHPEAPWENGKAERHGGWLKDRLDRELQSGRTVVQSLEDLDELLSSLTSTKNNWLNKGGFTPSQLVFGQMCRIPGELLTEDDLSLHGLQDAYEDPMEVDEAAGEYRRRHQIRERARQLAMEQSSKEAVRGAQHAAHQQPRKWNPGQWVYVFRRAKANQELHLRNRWVGPGLVVLDNNGTTYVAMRSRLWRCSSSQLRAALPSEILGKDLASDPGLAALLQRVVSGVRPGAVDVAKEGPPPQEGALAPVERVEDGVQMGDAPIQPNVPNEPVQHQAPQPVVPVPPGFLPIPPDPHVRVHERPPAPSSEVSGSRRSSTNEPLSEPGEASLSPVTPPGLGPIQEEDEGISSGGEVQEPQFKIPRIDNEAPVSPTQEPTGAASSSIPSSSTSTPAAASTEEVGTRAPGTPVGRLLDRVPRQPITPGEEIERPGIVERLAEEFDQMAQRHADEQRQQQHQAFSSHGWSGTFFNYCQGDEDLILGSDGRWTLMAKRNDEISLKELSAEEKKLFDESDLLEWKSILHTKAVRVLTGRDAERVRRLHPDRIISSRMVRRKKPLPEMHSWKAKSRWCLHGHHDPDTGTLMTYAPTPQSEGMMLFLQTGLNLGMKFAFSDVKNAFCQSNPLKRPKGPLYAEPCEGLNLPPGALIAIDIPVYGLDDAPAAWRQTVASFLVEDLGCVRNIVEPCWFSRFDKESGQCIAQVLVEVDDFIVAAVPSYYPTLQKQLKDRFTFGKWDENQAEYAGRRVRCYDDHILVDQHKYIHEQVHPIALAKGRRSQSGDLLTTEEFNMLRSLVYKINWVARETRPEAAGLASITASKLKEAKVSDILIVNKFVNFLRSTSDRPLKIWRFHPQEMCFIVCSDAGGINMKGLDAVDSEGLPTDATQGAWMVMAAARLPSGRQQVQVSPIAWRSSKLKRKVFSTYGGETQAMLQGVNEVDWLQVMYRDATSHDVQLSNWRNSLSPHMLVLRGECQLGGRLQQCSVTDAKSLYDCLLREHPSGKQDRKSALELAIVLRDLQETQSMVRWVPHQKMVVDCMTHEDPMRANDAMNHMLRAGILSLVDVSNELEARKTDPAFKKRSHSASRDRLLQEYRSSYVQFMSSLVNVIWGNCEMPGTCAGLRPRETVKLGAVMLPEGKAGGFLT